MKKINELPVATSASATDKLVIETSNGTKQVTKENLDKNLVKVQSTQPTEADNRIWINTNSSGTIELATEDEVAELKSDLDEVEIYKVAQPLDEHNQPTDGTNGQFLRTLGDGTTEWVDEGLPTDEQTAQAVSDWLDEHPEATTTVEDGSLTEAKFTESLKLKVIKDYVTPEMFGAVGDGVTDDTDAVQDALDSGERVVFYGVYAISRPLSYTGIRNIEGNDSTILTMDGFDGEYIIKFSGGTSRWMTFISDLTIDCDGNDVIGIYLKEKRVTLQNCVVLYCGGDAYYIEDAGGSHILNCSASNVNSKIFTGSEFANSIALRNNSADVYVENFDYIDFKIGIEHLKAFGFYNNIHGFVLRYLDYIWEGSCFFKTSASYNYALSIINSYPDSQQYAFSFSGHGQANIIGGTSIINSSVWNGTTRTKDNTYIIKSSSSDIQIKFFGFTFKGANGTGNAINLTDNTRDIRSVSINGCEFINCTNNLESVVIATPSFEGRTYSVNNLYRYGDRIAFVLEFSFSPATQGPITNSESIASMSSLNYIGRIPSVITDMCEFDQHSVLNGCYFDKTTGTVSCFPLIVYKSGSGIYIRPFHGDTQITNDNDTNTYRVWVSGELPIKQQYIEL